MNNERIGCVHSRIPEPREVAALAQPIFDNCPQYKLLVRTVRRTMFSCGRFPKHLRQSDFVENLIEEAVSLGVNLLGSDDVTLVAGAKSIVRRLIHREKHEVRWYETPDGSRVSKAEADSVEGCVRKSKAEFRIQHPLSVFDALDEESDEFDPLTLAIATDSDGKLVGIGRANVNEVEARMIEHVERLSQRLQIVNTVGEDNYRWMVEYVNRKRDGEPPIPQADRDKFRCLKRKCQKAWSRTDEAKKTSTQVSA